MTNESPSVASVTHLVVLFRCNDGKLRYAVLNDKQVKKTKGFVQHVQGGHLILRGEPLSVEELSVLAGVPLALAPVPEVVPTAAPAPDEAAAPAVNQEPAPTT